MGDPRTIGQCLSLILIARNLERIGDHATNISEEVIYWIHGRDIRHQGPRRHRAEIGGNLEPASDADNDPEQSQTGSNGAEAIS
jgi:phosphate transport system protein